MLRIKERLERIERRNAARERDAYVQEMHQKDTALEDFWRSGYAMTAALSVAFCIVLFLGRMGADAWKWVQIPANRTRMIAAFWMLCGALWRMAHDPAYRKQVACMVFDAACVVTECVITLLSDLVEETALHIATVLLLPLLILGGGMPPRFG